MDANFLLNTDLNNRKIILNTRETLDIGSPNYEDTFSYDHNLGRILATKVWYEPVAGRWYPLGIRLYDDSSAGGYLDVVGSYSLTLNTLTVTLRNVDISSPRTCDIIVRLYLDE